MRSKLIALGIIIAGFFFMRFVPALPLETCTTTVVNGQTVITCVENPQPCPPLPPGLYCH